jgi:hypothetical protein
MSKCVRCKKRDRFSDHPNAKYCQPCKELLRVKIEPFLYEDTKQLIRKYAGKIERKALAKKAGVSIATLKRFARMENLDITTFRYTDDEIKTVCEYYVVNGIVKTAEKFPHVKVRSIIERYVRKLGLDARQIRWTPQNLLEAAKMAGVISNNAQAKYFGRPNAYAGSIKSLWQKNFKCRPSNLNSCPHWIAKQIVDLRCPFYAKRGRSTKMFAFWADIHRNLKDSVSDEVKILVAAMAKFQKWLHNTENPQEVFEREFS